MITKTKKAALERVRIILEESYAPLRRGRTRRDVVAFAEIDSTSYVLLKKGRWTSTASWNGHAVDHFSLKNHVAGRAYNGGFHRRYRGDSRRAVRGLVALGLVSKEDGEIARLHFWELDSIRYDRETRNDLKRDARRLGVKLVFPKKRLSRR